LGASCPECGCAALKAGSPPRSPTCGACGKTLDNHESARSDKIRACTHCGCLLDAQGV
jgi:uncharacterized protein (DUF983 family)